MHISRFDFHYNLTHYVGLHILKIYKRDLELIARRHAGSGMFCGQLQTVTEDIFIFAVLVCSAH